MEDVRLESAADVLRVLELAVAAELSLPNSSRRNATLATLCGTTLRVLDSSELEARVAALEQRFGIHSDRRAG